MKHLIFETDWLASRPVFYNEKTGQASYNINDVIDYINLELHPEGFNNYLDFGYSVLEQTPIKHVKFLRHSSRLWRNAQGGLNVEYLDDPVERWLDYRLSEEDVIGLVRERVQKWEHSIEGEIVIPTSGGYDSRLLNWCIEDKSRIRSFTYGISENQSQSYEVVYAQRLSEIFGTRWEQILLGDYHRYLEDWDKLFGCSTHAHGMYHIEFYTKMLSHITKGGPFLSGIFGDVWAGNVHTKTLQSYMDLVKIGYTHGQNANSAESKLVSDRSIIQGYWAKEHHSLNDDPFQTLTLIRLKMILISYLLQVPRSFAFHAWSPFLDIDIAMAMLNLPPERRSNRIWQKDFFQKVGLDLESMHLPVTRQNTLDLQALYRIPVKPLDMKLLGEVVQPGYIEWINQNVKYGWEKKLINRLLGVPKIGGGLRMLGFSSYENVLSKAYNAYLVLLPIENLMKRRNLAQQH